MISRLAVMLYVRSPVSLRNVEYLLHESCVDFGHEAVRFWGSRFGPMFTSEIRNHRIQGMKSSRWRWHPDEMFVKINGEGQYLRRLTVQEGSGFESFGTKTRDKNSAFQFLQNAMRMHGQSEPVVTDKFRSYSAALQDFRSGDRQKTGKCLNSRAES